MYPEKLQQRALENECDWFSLDWMLVVGTSYIKTFVSSIVKNQLLCIPKWQIKL